MEVLSDKSVKIRKPHLCFACSRRFPVGSTMQSQTHTYDGINTVYSCQTCQTLMSEFKSSFFDDQEFVFPGDCVREIYSDYGVDNPEDLLLELRNEKIRP